MKKYMMVGEYMIEFTNKDVSEDVNIELSVDLAGRWEQDMGTKNIPDIGNHMCKDHGSTLM